jgi:hypothetical protein
LLSLRAVREVVLPSSAANRERHDVVDVPHHAGRAAHPAAVAAAEAVAPQDAEAQLRGQGIAGPAAARECNAHCWTGWSLASRPSVV